MSVRVLDARRIETIGAIGGAARDVPRELAEITVHRLAEWIDGRSSLQLADASTTHVARTLLTELELRDDQRVWIHAFAHGSARGAILVQTRTIAPDDLARLAIIAEAIGTIVAKERTQRDLVRVRDTAAATQATAFARATGPDLGVAVVGAETGLRDVMRHVDQVAPTSAPVLIYGETGSGKEVVSRAIHERSDRANGPLLKVNCGAISPELIDSELFGHERGSFTGAHTTRPGWFERADGGTLFLDEIGELPLAAQVRLLRVVQDGVFERVGGTRPLQVDVRVIAATHRDLGAMADRGTFRADLWYRINVFTIRLPPLRERQDDIPALACHFATLAARRLGAPPLTIGPDELAMLHAYEWPGNVRELAAVIERATILGEGRRLDVRRALGSSTDAGTGSSTLDAAIRVHIERALGRCHGRIDGPRGAARILGLHPNTLRSKIQKIGIAAAHFRPEAA